MDTLERPEAKNAQLSKDASSSLTNAIAPTAALSEEDAKQVIDMLRADDMGARVAAAHRLDLVALTLGEQRTREVRYTHSLFVPLIPPLLFIYAYPNKMIGTSSFSCRWF